MPLLLPCSERYVHGESGYHRQRSSDIYPRGELYQRADDASDATRKTPEKIRSGDQYPRRNGGGSERYTRGSEGYADGASDSLVPEDVYDSIRRTTADIRQYVKMDSSTASPPPSATRTGGSRGGAKDSYHLPVTRSPDKRAARQRYATPAQVCL